MNHVLAHRADQLRRETPGALARIGRALRRATCRHRGTAPGRLVALARRSAKKRATSSARVFSSRRKSHSTLCSVRVAHRVPSRLRRCVCVFLHEFVFLLSSPCRPLPYDDDSWFDTLYLLRARGGSAAASCAAAADDAPRPTRPSARGAPAAGSRSAATFEHRSLSTPATNVAPSDPSRVESSSRATSLMNPERRSPMPMVFRVIAARPLLRRWPRATPEAPLWALPTSRSPDDRASPAWRLRSGGDRSRQATHDVGVPGRAGTAHRGATAASLPSRSRWTA